MKKESSQQTAPSLPGLGRLAHILDSSIRLPGGFRIGLDGIIGLVPVAGNAAGAIISSWIILQGARLGAPATTLMRMMLNVLIEVVVGAVPVLGNLFDFAWKANNRNVRVLERRLTNAEPVPGTRRRLGAAVMGVLAAFVVVLVFTIYLTLRLFLALASALVGVI